MENTLTERNILEKINSPFLIKMVYAFQSETDLYYILEYCPGGELFFYLQKIGRFKETAAKFYAANILLALRDLHNYKIVYRDLKPENVLLDSEGYLKITDFGLSRENVSQPTGYFDHHSDQNSENNKPKQLIVGTAEYMAPEVLQGNGYG